ncbi:MAG: hypothetical protein AAF573_11180 [Bacteroidota bacterium]
MTHIAHQLNDFTKLVSDIPQTKVVLDHVGTPVGLGGQPSHVGRTPQQRDFIFKKWYDDLVRLAEVTHVQLKLSGLLMPVCGFQFKKRRQPTTLNEKTARGISKLSSQT